MKRTDVIEIDGYGVRGTLTKTDDKKSKRYALELGSRSIMPGVGQNITVNKKAFRVVGVNQLMIDVQPETVAGSEADG